MTAAFSGSPKNCFADKLRLILTRVCKGEFELQSKSIISNHKTNGILDNSLIFNLVFKHKTVGVLSLEQQLKIIYVPWTMSYCLAIIQSPNPNYQSPAKTYWSTYLETQPMASPKCSFCHYAIKVKPKQKQTHF